MDTKLFFNWFTGLILLVFSPLTCTADQTLCPWRFTHWPASHTGTHPPLACARGQLPGSLLQAPAKLLCLNCVVYPSPLRPGRGMGCGSGNKARLGWQFRFLGLVLFSGSSARVGTRFTPSGRARVPGPSGARVYPSLGTGCCWGAKESATFGLPGPGSQGYPGPGPRATRARVPGLPGARVYPSLGPGCCGFACQL